MESLMPSEIARLVLGYLKEEGCQDSYNAFLRESPHLVEYASLLKAGREYSTKVGNMRLQDILDKHTEGHRDEGKEVVCKTNERPDESHEGKHSKPCADFSSEEQPKEANTQKSPVQATTPMSTTHCLATPVKSAVPQPFRDFKSPRRKSHAPKRRSVEPNQLAVEKPVTLDVVPAPSAAQVQSDPGVSNDSTASEPVVCLPLLEEMLSNTHFAEILADNINKVVVQQEESQHAKLTTPQQEESQQTKPAAPQQEGSQQTKPAAPQQEGSQQTKPAAPQPSERQGDHPSLDHVVAASLAGSSDRTTTEQSLGLNPTPAHPTSDQALMTTATEPSASDVLDRILEETPMTDNAINGIIEMTKNDPSFDALFNLFKVGPAANSTGNTTEGTLSTPTYSKEFFSYDDGLASSGDFTPATNTPSLLGGAVRTTVPNDADNLVGDNDFSFCEVGGVASATSTHPSRADAVHSSSFVSVGDVSASYSASNDTMVPLANISRPQFTTIDGSAISAVNSIPGNRCASTVLTVAAPAGTVSVWPGQQLPTLSHSLQSTPSPDFTATSYWSSQPSWKMTTKSTKRGQRRGVGKKLNVGPPTASVASRKKKKQRTASPSPGAVTTLKQTIVTSPVNLQSTPAAEPVNSFAILTSALTSPAKLQQISPAPKSCENETLLSTQVTPLIKHESCAKETHLDAPEINRPRSVQLIKPAPAAKLPVILAPLCNGPLGTLTNKPILPATNVTTPISVVLLPSGSSVKDTVGRKRKRTPRNPKITISKKRQVLGIPGKCLPESSNSTPAASATTSTLPEVQAGDAQLSAQPKETDEAKAKQPVSGSPVLLRLDDFAQNDCESFDSSPNDQGGREKPEHLGLNLKSQVQDATSEEKMIVGRTETALKSLARLKSPARRLSSVISETLPTSAETSSLSNSQPKSPQKGVLRCAYKPGASEPSPSNTPHHSSTLASSPASHTPNGEASSQKLQSSPKTDTGVAIRTTGSSSKSLTSTAIIFASPLGADGKSFTRKLSFEDTLHSDTNSPMLTIDLSNGFSPVGPNVLSAPNSHQPSQVEEEQQPCDSNTVVEECSQPQELPRSETEVETSPSTRELSTKQSSSNNHSVPNEPNTPEKMPHKLSTLRTSPCTQEHSTKQSSPDNHPVPNEPNAPEKMPHKLSTLRKMLEGGDTKQETDPASNSFNDSISPDHKSRKKKKKHKRHDSEHTFTCARTRGWQKEDKAKKFAEDAATMDSPDMVVRPPSPQRDAGQSLVPYANNCEASNDKTTASEAGATCSSAALPPEPKTQELEDSHNVVHRITEQPKLSPVSALQDNQNDTNKDNNQSQVVDSIPVSTSSSPDKTLAAPLDPPATINEPSSRPPQSSIRATTNGNPIPQGFNSPHKEWLASSVSSASNPATTLPPVSLAVAQSKEAEVAEALVCFAEKAVITPKSERPSLVSITNIDFVPNFEAPLLMPVRKLYAPPTPPKFILTNCCGPDNKVESLKNQVVDANLCLAQQGDKKGDCPDIRDTSAMLETSNGSETKEHKQIPGVDVKKKQPRRIVPIKLDSPPTAPGSQSKNKTCHQPGLNNKPSDASGTSTETNSTPSTDTVSKKTESTGSLFCSNPNQTPQTSSQNHAHETKTPTKQQPQPPNHRLTASPVRSNPLTKLLETIMTPPSPKKKARKRPCQPKTPADNPKKALASMDIEKFLAKLHSKKQA